MSIKNVENMPNWETKLKTAIEAAAEEIKTSAFATFMSANKLVTSARIVVEINSDCVVTVKYETDCIPRQIFKS